jgi:hypothetical protein
MEKKEYICEKCNYKTEFKHSYEKHLTTELHKTGKRKERSDKKILDKCPHCDYTSKVNTDIQTHIISKHMSEKEQKEKFKFYCDYCKIGFLYESQHNIHLTLVKHKKNVYSKNNK